MLENKAQLQYEFLAHLLNIYIYWTTYKKEVYVYRLIILSMYRFFLDLHILNTSTLIREKRPTF